MAYPSNLLFYIKKNEGYVIILCSSIFFFMAFTFKLIFFVNEGYVIIL